MGSHSTSGRTEGTGSASPSPSPRHSLRRSARSSRAGGTDTFPRTVSTPKAPQVDPSPSIYIGKIAPLSLPKIPTKSETFDPPHFRPADGRPTPLQPFRLRLQGFRSVGLPSATPHAQGGPRPHTPTNHLESNHTRSTAIIAARHMDALAGNSYPKKRPRTGSYSAGRVFTFSSPALKALWNEYGGRGGSRTHGKVAPTSDFESGALNHSATLPYVEVRRSSFAESEVYIDGWRFCKLQSVWRVQLYLYRARPDR